MSTSDANAPTSDAWDNAPGNAEIITKSEWAADGAEGNDENGGYKRQKSGETNGW